MALWGMADDKTSTGTIEIAANGDVTGSGTAFDTEARVGDFIVANDEYFRIKTVDSATTATVVRANPGTVVNAIGAGNNYTLNEKPMYLNNDSTGVSIADVYGVDPVEESIVHDVSHLTDVGHAGWVRRIEKTDQHGATRVSWEVLVAGSSITGDAADDAYVPDYFITVTSDPEANSGSSSGDDQPEFSVAADTTPTGQLVTFVWEYTTEVGNADSFATTVAVSGFGGQTSNTLIVDANTIPDQTEVRCLVGGNGHAQTITSGSALLTVTA